MKLSNNMNKDYLFRYIGDDGIYEFICSAGNGDEAMQKFKKYAGVIAEIDEIFIF